MNSKPSQNSIGRELGLSPATMSKMRKQGCPMDSVEAVRAWREHNIAPTMHKHVKRSNPRQTGAVQHAVALMAAAGAALEAGKSIKAKVPRLRAALHAVPERERPAVLVHAGVMDVLVTEVGAVLAEDDGAGEAPAAGGEPMTDEEAEWMGTFWYRVAAGEIRPT